MRTAPARRSSASGLGKTPTTSVRRVFSLFPVPTVGRPELAPVQLRERGEGERVVVGLGHHRLYLGQLPAEHAGDDVVLLGDMGGVGLVEHGADRRGDNVGVALRHDRQRGAHEVHTAALLARAEPHRADRRFQPGVGIGYDQPHPAQAAGFQRAQERCPQFPVLPVPDVHAQHLPAPVGIDPDHDGLGHDPPAHPGRAQGRIEDKYG